MMENNIMDYNQEELETVDSYIHETHFEDAPFYDDDINESDEASIDRLLRRSSMEFTHEFLETIEKKLTPDNFTDDDKLNDKSLLQVFGTDEPEAPETEWDNDIPLVKLGTVFRKAA
ncbi:MAG: hypothetical protein HQK83_09155 [Fibrobacteria bacterium]|nr:hypothetical protein [Fibrobacteria bacterium]